jgi:hypothetical protein
MTRGNPNFEAMAQPYEENATVSVGLQRVIEEQCASSLELWQELGAEFAERLAIKHPHIFGGNNKLSPDKALEHLAHLEDLLGEPVSLP